MNKISIGSIGGLGDCSITRKYSALCENPLKESFNLEYIADIYPEDIVNNPSKFKALLMDIKKRRLKGKVEERVLDFLKQRGSNGLTYSQLDKKNPRIPFNHFIPKNKNCVMDISTPNEFHFELTKQVLDNSPFHILLEKPAALSFEEALAFEYFLKHRENNGRVIMDAEHYSHYGNVRYYLSHLNEFCNDRLNCYGLGKIKGIELFIEEDERFSSERNREIIEIAKSGGGMWLDTGIHAIGFLRNLGGVLDYNSVEAKPVKCSDPQIQGKKYGETAMLANFNILPNEHIAKKCHVSISVGKGFKSKRKLFLISHEHGKVEINMLYKSICAYHHDKAIFECKFSEDAFYNVLDDLRKSILYKEKPMTDIYRAIQNVKDVFFIQGKADPIQNVN